MSVFKQPLVILGSSLVVVVIIFFLSLLPYGSRPATVLETVKGIPYLHLGDSIQVTEPLAHLDVQLQEPVVAKTIRLQFEYDPQAVKQLTVGVRENAFWLSYPLHTIYHASPSPTTGWRSADISIPLTDALQDTDRSIDVMFIADPQRDLIQTVLQPNPTTNWQIRNIQAEVTYDWPTVAQLKNYIKSIVYMERPL